MKFLCRIFPILFAACAVVPAVAASPKQAFSFSTQGFYTQSTTQSKSTGAEHSDSGSGAGFSINYDRFFNPHFSLGVTAGMNIYPSRDEGDWHGKMIPVDRRKDDYEVEWGTDTGFKQSRRVRAPAYLREAESLESKWVTGSETTSHQAYFLGVKPAVYFFNGQWRMAGLLGYSHHTWQDSVARRGYETKTLEDQHGHGVLAGFETSVRFYKGLAVGLAYHIDYAVAEEFTLIQHAYSITVKLFI